VRSPCCKEEEEELLAAMNVIGARRALLPERLPGRYLLHGFAREREREEPEEESKENR